jgi:hypothetical protein
MGDNPPSKWIYFLGLLRCAWPSKLSDFVAMHHRRKRFEGHKHPQPPQQYIHKLVGLSPIHLTRRRGAQGLMWGARGPFPPAAAMVVAVVTPVVFCVKATERQNKITKISCLLQKSLFIIFIVKHIVIHISLLVHGRARGLSPNHFCPPAYWVFHVIVRTILTLY